MKKIGNTQKFESAECEEVIRECAEHSDLDNVNVPASLIPLIVKILSSNPGGLMVDIACGRGSVLRGHLRKTPTLAEGDLILMRTGATSKISIYENTFDKPVVLSSNLFVCRLKKDKVNPWYLKAFLESDGGKSLIASIAIGAVIKSISIRSLEDMRIPLPPMEKQNQIAMDFKAKFDRLRDLKKEVETLGREMTEVFK